MSQNKKRKQKKTCDNCGVEILTVYFQALRKDNSFKTFELSISFTSEVMTQLKVLNPNCQTHISISS